MSRRSTEQQSRRHIWLYDKDWKTLQELFGDSLGPGPVIRTLVERYCNGLRARQQQLIDQSGVEKEVSK